MVRVHNLVGDTRQLVPPQTPNLPALLSSPGIDSKESIPPANLAWRAGMETLFVVPACQAT